VRRADNAASLADALRAVMVSRREQDNFQLVVITHDEHFARWAALCRCPAALRCAEGGELT
jgi:DNA repair exonuclease SbcCD ATPase subunit